MVETMEILTYTKVGSCVCASFHFYYYTIICSIIRIKEGMSRKLRGLDRLGSFEGEDMDNNQLRALQCPGACQLEYLTTM
jgi:hypothetical protein